VPREFGELDVNEELEDIASFAIYLYTTSCQIESSDQSSLRLFFPWLRLLSSVRDFVGWLPCERRQYFSVPLFKWLCLTS
jgi:hypothetical protein